MSDFTRLVRPAQSQINVEPTSKECLAEGINYPLFRLLNKTNRISLSPQYLSTDPAFVYRNLAVSNSRGWFAAIQNSGSFGVILSPLSDLRKAMKEANGNNPIFTSQRTLSFSTSEPTYITFACNDTRLIVGFKSGDIVSYDTSAVFSPGTTDIAPLNILRTSASPIIQIQSNPSHDDQGLAELTAVVRADSTVQLLNKNLEVQGGWAAGDANSAPVTVAWSPKGKQLAIGLQFGDIMTFTLSNKASPQRHIPPSADGKLVSLNWLSPGHTFRTSYVSTTPGNSDPVHHIVHSDSRTSPISWTRLEHSFQAPDRSRQSSYVAILPRWDDDADDNRLLVIVGDFSCTDLEIIGNMGNQWYQQSQENPLSIPLDKEAEDTFLLSLELDLTDIDETEGGYPIVYAYLNDGTIQGWYVDHPERKRYVGLVGSTNTPAYTTVADSSTSTSAFSQSREPQTSVISGPAATSSPSVFGQAASVFGSPQPSTTFGQAGFEKPVTTSTFGQPSFRQTAFGPSSAPQTGFASSSSSGGFSAFASTSHSPFGTGGFGSAAPAASLSAFDSAGTTSPQITRDESMSDSTPAFGGLSLGGSSESSSTQTSSTFGGGGIFATSTPLPLPPDHPENQSSPSHLPTPGSGSGGGSVIKPATGFGAFGNNSSTSAFGSGGVFGGTSSTSASAFSAGAFSAKPNQPSAFGNVNNEQPKSIFGQSGMSQPSFGQPAFGKSAFGQPAFGQSGFSTKAPQPSGSPASGGFTAFSQGGLSSFGKPTTLPSSGGFASFANGPSGLNSALPAGKSAFGAETSQNSSTSSPNAFGTKKADGAATVSSGGAFNALASSGPSVFGHPAQSSGGPFNTLKSETSSVFAGPASAAAFGAAPSALGGGSVSGTDSAFQRPVFATDNSSTSLDSPTLSPTQSGSSSPASAASGSPTATPSRSSPSPAKHSASPPATPAPGVFGYTPPSGSVFKPSTGFGAFGSALPTSSPFFNANKDKPSTVSVFSNLSPAPKTSTPDQPTTLSVSATPTFGSPSKLGFGFGLAKISSDSVTPTTTPTKIPASTAFSAFSGSSSAFGVLPGPKKSFGELLKEGEGDKGKDTVERNQVFVSPSSSKSADTELPVPSATTSVSSKQDQPIGTIITTSPSTTTLVVDAGETTTSHDKNTDGGEPSSVKKENRDVSDENVGVTGQPSHDSLSSQASSYVDVSHAEVNDNEQEVPDSDEDSDGESDQHGDEGDFLSESYDSQSGAEDEGLSEIEERTEEEEEEEEEEDAASRIPLPRSRSSTPQTEVPLIAVSTSPVSEESDSSRLSTIREESTTPPGSPTKSPSEPSIASPTPVVPPALPVGLGRPNTRPTRSSPLANVPLSGDDEEDIENKTAVTNKPRPASPKQPFGVLPSLVKSVEEEIKPPPTKRPKTPPLSSIFGGTATASPASSPAAPMTSSKQSNSLVGPGTPLFGTRVAGGFTPPAPPGTPSLFGKAFGTTSPSPPIGSNGENDRVKPSNIFATPSPPSTAGGFFGGKPLGVFGPASGDASPKPSSFASTFGGKSGQTPPLGSPQTNVPPVGVPKLSSSAPAGVSGNVVAPSAGSVATPLRAPVENPLSLEDGMRKECAILFAQIMKELDDLRQVAELTAKKREALSRSAGGSRRKEDLGDDKKWSLCDAVQFGVVLKELESDIKDLKMATEKQKEALSIVNKDMVKAGARREEIARFNKAKSDNEFSKMLKSRTLGPEHLENQTQLRRNIRTLQTRVEQLEDQLRAHKRKLSELNTGRPVLRAPSLDTVNRTYRNIDIAFQQQTDELKALTSRISKLTLNTASASSATSLGARDSRLPPVAPRARPSIITPDVAVTTAAALNAERSAHKLKTMLLKVRTEPLLNTKARDATEGGERVPVAFSTPGRMPVPNSLSAATPASQGLQFNTPIMQGPLFGQSAIPTNWDTLSFPEDKFQPVTPVPAGRRGATQKKQHGSVALKKSPGVSAGQSESPPATSFDWGPLPTFQKASPGLPGFDKILAKPSSSPSLSAPATPPAKATGLGFGLGSFGQGQPGGLFGNLKLGNDKEK